MVHRRRLAHVLARVAGPVGPRQPRRRTPCSGSTAALDDPSRYPPPTITNGDAGASRTPTLAECTPLSSSGSPSLSRPWRSRPGQAPTLTLSYAPHGPRAVVSVIAGTGLGTFTHATLAAVGLAAVVMRSAQVYRAIQLAGRPPDRLGISMLRSVNRKSLARFDLARGRGPLLTAYIANLLNPKAAGVYLTLAPQFIPAHNMDLTAMESLAATHVVVVALWLSCVGFTLSAAARRHQPRENPARDPASGSVVLIALGVRTSTEAVA